MNYLKAYNDSKPGERSRIFLITGGTSGLGLELVHLFLEKGYNVVATGRQQINLHGIRRKVHIVQC